MDKSKQYIDLTDEAIKISDYKIDRQYFDAVLTDGKTNYDGFILAKTPAGKHLTVCDLNFHLSDKTNRCEARPTFRRTDPNYETIPANCKQIMQRISFNSTDEGYPAFWKMIAFLEKYNEYIETGSMYNFRIASDEDIISAIKDKNVSEQINIIQQALAKSEINDSELLLIAKRKNALENFRKLLDNKEYIEEYRKTNNIKSPGIEPVWHDFFKKNKWIFGLNLDYRSFDELLDEQSIGYPNSKNHGNPKTDMLGLNDFMTIIEIKTPDAKFFREKPSNTARANTWSFDSDFIGAFSQCLAQKDAFLKRIKTLEITDDNGNYIDSRRHKLIDPRVILIYGNKEKELPFKNNEDYEKKAEMLENFIRDSRNITIVTFDELYRRAEQIIGIGDNGF